MKNNNSKKTNIIFIIWGSIISVIILFLLVIIFLYSKSNNLNNKSKIKYQEQDKTYNRILNKTEKKVDKLTPQSESSKSTNQPNISTPNLKYPPKIFYKLDGKTINYIKEYDQLTSKIIKEIYYNPDGKTINYIKEYDPSKMTKYNAKTIYYNLDGTIKNILKYN